MMQPYQPYSTLQSKSSVLLHLFSSGLSVESATSFANRGMEHTQASVRDAAVNLILELYKIKGQEVRSRLPPEDHPKVQKNRPLYGKLFDGMDKIDGKPTKSERKVSSFREVWCFFRYI